MRIPFRRFLLLQLAFSLSMLLQSFHDSQVLHPLLIAILQSNDSKSIVGQIIRLGGFSCSLLCFMSNPFDYARYLFHQFAITISSIRLFFSCETNYMKSERSLLFPLVFYEHSFDYSYWLLCQFAIAISFVGLFFSCILICKTPISLVEPRNITVVVALLLQLASSPKLQHYASFSLQSQCKVKCDFSPQHNNDTMLLINQKFYRMVSS